MKTKIISAFPACGKSFMTKTIKDDKFNGILDSDSSNFSWIKDENGDNTTERDPNFPNNYIQHIRDNIGKVSIVFVSSHDVVRKALEENNIEYYLIYPDIELKYEWLDRMRTRGNDVKFIKFIETNWDNFIEDIENEEFPTKIKLANDDIFITKELLEKIIKN